MLPKDLSLRFDNAGDLISPFERAAGTAHAS
jgi:hypothetical protein